MTHLEKIKVDIQNMTAKELATKFYSLFTCNQCKNVDCNSAYACFRGYVKWLESEVDNKQVCGNCFYNTYKVYDKRYGDSFYCNNPDSDNYGCDTFYDDSCEDWEEK